MRSDILKQDREKKEAFLSQYLFCGLTPVYPQTAVRLASFKEKEEVYAEDRLLVLREGLVRRKGKAKN
jgi:hypothetical protein